MFDGRRDATIRAAFDPVHKPLRPLVERTNLEERELPWLVSSRPIDARRAAAGGKEPAPEADPVRATVGEQVAGEPGSEGEVVPGERERVEVGGAADAAEAELARRMDAVRNAAEEIQALRRSLVQEARRELVELVVEVGQAVVGATPSVAPDALRGWVEEAMAGAPEGSDVVLRVHPEDVGLLPEDLTVSIVVDSTLRRGEFRASSEGWRVDSRREERLRRIAEALWKEVA